MGRSGASWNNKESLHTVVGPWLEVRSAVPGANFGHPLNSNVQVNFHPNDPIFPALDYFLDMPAHFQYSVSGECAHLSKRYSTIRGDSSRHPTLLKKSTLQGQVSCAPLRQPGSGYKK